MFPTHHGHSEGPSHHLRTEVPLLVAHGPEGRLQSAPSNVQGASWPGPSLSYGALALLLERPRLAVRQTAFPDAGSRNWTLRFGLLCFMKPIVGRLNG